MSCYLNQQKNGTMLRYMYKYFTGRPLNVNFARRLVIFILNAYKRIFADSVRLHWGQQMSDISLTHV